MVLTSADSPDWPRFDDELTRDRLLAALRLDLLGPESDEEELTQSPKTRYLVGMLAPRGTGIDASEDEQELAQGEGEDSGDANVPLRNSLEASAIGLSVVVDGAVKSITAEISWGEYDRHVYEELEDADPELVSDLHRDEDPADVVEGKTRQVKRWKRRPCVETVEISLTDVPKEGDYADLSRGGVEVRYVVRTHGNERIVSVFLDNRRQAPLEGRPDDEDYLYQPRIELSGEGHPFLPRRMPGDRIDPDPDLASADLVYRKRLEFGVGHGVAAAWNPPKDNRTSRVQTEIMPAHEVPRVTPRESELLSMDHLASADVVAAQATLHEFLNEYEDWLVSQTKESVDGEIAAVASDHLQLARDSLDRMREGVGSLDDPAVFAAFQFANRAMALQRRHTEQVLSKRRQKHVPDLVGIAANWRPFQMGFMLQALGGLANPLHDDRDIADLLWFPTGGGKTEAYLGLTAFILAYRRLRHDEQFDSAEGTAVIMRYTLRLLTIQQFQRALTLICACEVIRAEDPISWGDKRFTIGLWVGQSVTPNRYEDAKTALNTLRAKGTVFEKSPYQILFCPWCGDGIAPENYVSDDDEQRTYVKCWNLDCDFHVTKVQHGLPALMVDSEIYRNPPSLLLATVDKFAQMTWNGKIQTLFGRVDRRCERHGWISQADDHPNSHQKDSYGDEIVVTRAPRSLAPPDLIIQDELHLISGPLGTLVGIYEAAVDALSSRLVDGKVVRPKVIASTATVRRASAQVRGIFDREVAIFPPQGLDVADSFFAVENRDEPGRLYVGVFGPGRSIKTTLVRTYGALLGRAKLEFDTEQSVENDAYMTLVGYFNSLRELGGALRLIEDDVPSRLRALRKRGFSDSRVLYETRELTSRKSSSGISETLDRLDRTFLDIKERQYPIDVLLASNMISVGVDIDRLGLMVVSGQPKTTAEYIQATSRVGRQHPGLVVQVFNWIRPRDISHYERFHHYHDTFYRHVEATSVTPFSERARDRALPAVLVAHARLQNPEWSAEAGAGLFDSKSESVVAFKNFLIERARSVARFGDDVAADLRRELDHRYETWDNLTLAEHGLVYSWRGRGKKSDDSKAVLLRPMELDATKGEWPASGSLREVEEEAQVVLIE